MSLAFAREFSETSSYLNDPTGMDFFFDYTGLGNPIFVVLTAIAVGVFLSDFFFEPQKRSQDTNEKARGNREYKKNAATKARSVYLREKMNDITRRRKQGRRKR